MVITFEYPCSMVRDLPRLRHHIQILYHDACLVAHRRLLLHLRLVLLRGHCGLLRLFVVYYLISMVPSYYFITFLSPSLSIS